MSRREPLESDTTWGGLADVQVEPLLFRGVFIYLQDRVGAAEILRRVGLFGGGFRRSLLLLARHTVVQCAYFYDWARSNT